MQPWIGKVQTKKQLEIVMFSKRLKKKVAKLLVYVMMLTNISPAFTMDSRADYQVVVRQNSESLTGQSLLQIEAFKATEQILQGVARTIYEAVATQTMLMMAAILTGTQQISSERVVNIEGVGKFKLDENDAIIVDSWIDPSKSIEFVTDRNVVINSLRGCDKLSITAPNVTIRGETFIKSLGISLLSPDGVFAVENGSVFKSGSLVVNGKFYNNGTLEFLQSVGASLTFEDFGFFNYGVVRGENFSIQNARFFFNSDSGVIQGQKFELQSNVLINNGIIGARDSDISLQIHKSFTNANKFLGRSVQLLFTSENGGLFNNGEMDLLSAGITIAGTLQNKSKMHFGEINGFIGNFLNEARFLADAGVLTVNSGENRHILILKSLVTNEEFLNRFSGEDSVMQFSEISGAGRFTNHGIFSVDGTGILGIGVFQNKNVDYVSRYGAKSFGDTIKFVHTLRSFLNEGSFIADSIIFETEDAEITNVAGATIQTKQETKGIVHAFSNSGTVSSAESSVTLNFGTFTNRGQVTGHQGVFFSGNTLRNYTNLSLINPSIKHLFNGESIIDDIDDAFFSSMEKQIWETAEQISVSSKEDQKNAIADILEHISAVNMLHDDVNVIRIYHDALTKALEVPVYNSLYHLEQVHGWNGHFSLWNKFATNPKTGIKTFIQQIPLYSNAQANQVTLEIQRTNNIAVAANKELDKKVEQAQAALEAIPFPLQELHRVIPAYNKRSVSKTAANLWLYNGSSTEQLGNTGHVEFLRGIHNVDLYLGTKESELLLPENEEAPEEEQDQIAVKVADITSMPLLNRRTAVYDILHQGVVISEADKTALDNWITETTPPDYSPTFITTHIPWNAPQLGGAYSQSTQWAINYLNHSKSYVQTHNLFDNLQAAQVSAAISNSNSQGASRNAVLESQYVTKLKTPQFPMDALRHVISDNREIFIKGEQQNTWGFMFSEEPKKSRALQSTGTTKVNEKKIEGSGKIQAAEQIYHNIDQIMPFSLFGDINVYTEVLPNALPTFSGNISLFITAQNAVNKYGMNMALYKKYFGKAKLVSREGSISLEACRFIENHYGYILAKTGFNFLSSGMVINHTGYVHSSGTEPSYINALGLYEHCDEQYWMLFGDPSPYHEWHQHLPYDSSEKPVIYSGGIYIWE